MLTFQQGNLLDGKGDVPVAGDDRHRGLDGAQPGAAVEAEQISYAES
ncbi:hypothetical protein ACFFU8_00215 [Chromobacterium piscinae]|uniref:Uncharacterized protein n=1 Tax=Chromobacterium piscinae TaxID=686831 RepID=A0ABV0H242_9NEIS|nr:hypothetical protein [Chromobacterium piscinae]MCD5326619.1 hypothetical protein [Chromobacterium piscinae]